MSKVFPGVDIDAVHGGQVSQLTDIQTCKWCGLYHPHQMCSRVKSISYHQDGSVKDVEFHEPTPQYVQGEDSKDAAKWREHVEVLKAAMIPGALYMRLQMYEHGQKWAIEYVLDAERFGRNTVLGVKAVGLAAEQKATELFEAIERSGISNGE